MLSGGTRLGPYDIVGPLGAGGMGVVYRARDTRLAREVAVKMLPEAVRGDPERLRRFELEARAAGALNHPNLVVVFDVGEHEGAPFLVTELLEGETLRQRLKAGPLPWRKATALAAQLSRGLAAAHEKGIVHRDLKPENLFLTSDGRAKILDFGLARMARHEPSPPNATLSQTDSGQVLGTAGYMSPEQVRGHAATEASDLFAFGAVLYEMLTGQSAFGGETPVERGYAVLSREVPAVSAGGVEVPPALERLVRRCLEKTPGERFRSAGDLAFALEGLLEDAPSSQPHGAPAARLPATGRAGWGWALGAGLLLAAAALAIATRQSAPAAPAPPPAEPSQPVFTRINFRRGVVNPARFAPDGRSVIYEAALEGKLRQVFSATPGNPSARELTREGAGLFAISSQGELALSISPPSPLKRAHRLARAPLSGGAPREELEDIVVADYGPDGKHLAVVRSLEGRQVLEFPVGTVRAQTTGWFSHLRVSRDGKSVAVLEHPVYGDDRGTVEVIEVETGKRTRISGPWYSLWGAAWSPDGREVWFAACETMQTSRGLYAGDLAGRTRLLLSAPGNLTLEDVSVDGRVLLTRLNARARIGSWQDHGERSVDLSWFDGSQPISLSRDGKALLFIEGLAAAGGEVQVWVRPTRGGDAVNLSQGLARALSADGALALISPKEPFTTLALVPTGPGEVRQLPAGEFAQIGDASFSADGKFIVFMAGVGNEEFRLWVQALDGGPPRAVTQPGVVASSVVSTAGLVAFQLRDGSQWKLALPDGKPERFLGVGTEHIPLAFSADGETLWLRVVPPRHDQVRPIELVALDVKTGKLSPFAQITAPDPLGLQPDLDRVLVSEDGSKVVYAYHANEGELYLVEGLR